MLVSSIVHSNIASSPDATQTETFMKFAVNIITTFKLQAPNIIDMDDQPTDQRVGPRQQQHI